MHLTYDNDQPFRFYETDLDAYGRHEYALLEQSVIDAPEEGEELAIEAGRKGLIAKGDTIYLEYYVENEVIHVVEAGRFRPNWDAITREAGYP